MSTVVDVEDIELQDNELEENSAQKTKDVASETSSPLDLRIRGDVDSAVTDSDVDTPSVDNRETSRSNVFKQSEARLYSEKSLVQMQKELMKAVSEERQKVELDKQGIEYRKRLTAIPIRHKAKSCWTMGYFIDYLVHVSWLGRLLFAVWVLLPPINYGKDFFVAYLCWKHDHKGFFLGTIIITILSSRLLLMTYFDLESIRPRKFLFYLIPGSVCLDFKPEEWTDVAVWLIWEFALLILSPFTIFLLLYLAFRRTMYIFECIEEFDGSYTLAFNVIELIFETIPQLTLQLLLYLKFVDNTLPLAILDIGIIICVLSLVKIPLTLLWNWSVILNNRLIFKRHHNSVVKTVKFHPTRDVLASGSWDCTVLFHAVLTGNIVKAKRVASCGRMQINCLCFTRDGSRMAVGGHGLRIWDDSRRRYVLKLPVRKKGVSKRPRGAEISHITFSPDNRYVLCAEGPVVAFYDVESGELVKRSYCIERSFESRGPTLGSISAMALSHTGNILLTGSTTDTDIYVWRLDGIELEPASVRQDAHTETINSLVFTKDSRYFLSGSSDNTVKIWNVENPEEIKFVMKYISDTPIISLAVGAMVEPAEEVYGEEQVREILKSASNSDVYLVDEVIDEFPCQPLESSSYCAPPVFTPAEYLRIGRAILVTGGIRTVTVWDLVTGDQLQKWEHIDGVINSVDVSPYGEFIAIGTDRYHVTLLSLNSIVQQERSSRLELEKRSNATQT